MKGWIFTTQENLSYETKRLIECFEKEGVECFAVHPNHVDIFISKENIIVLNFSYVNLY